jgi:hypothetical protein
MHANIQFKKITLLKKYGVVLFYLTILTDFLSKAKICLCSVHGRSNVLYMHCFIRLCANGENALNTFAIIIRVPDLSDLGPYSEYGPRIQVLKLHSNFAKSMRKLPRLFRIYLFFHTKIKENLNVFVENVAF